MRSNIKFHIHYIILLVVLMFISCDKNTVQQVKVRGVYGNPNPLWDRGFNLKDLGVNAVFVNSGSINQEMITRARSEGLQVFAEFATLNGKNYVEKHPEAWAINEKGEQVKSASWFMGVCPSEPGFRKYRFNQLRDLLQKYDLDGVWMDYVHWHAQFEDPEPILPETCFCEHCLHGFSAYSSIEIPILTLPEKAQWILNNHDKAWRDWRCWVIFDWTVEMKKIIKEIKPEAVLGLYHCPWDDQEYDGARRRILGLDYDLLKETVDVFSPMVYHGSMGRNPEWVQENIIWFCNRLNVEKDTYPKVWPIVQAHDDPAGISPKEFEIVLKGGLTAESSGVMMFTTHAIAADEDKTEVMKRVYTDLID